MDSAHSLLGTRSQHSASLSLLYDFNSTRFILKHRLTERTSLYAAGYIALKTRVGKFDAALVKQLPVASDYNRRCTTLATGNAKLW